MKARWRANADSSCSRFAAGAKLRPVQADFKEFEGPHGEDRGPRVEIEGGGRHQRRYRGGAAAFPLPHPGRDPHGRAARLRPLPAEPREGHQPPFARTGGGGGRLCRCDEAGRSLLLHLSRPCPYARARRAGGAGPGRADAARQRAHARQGRLDASHLGRARRDGLLRHHRRASSDRLRRRLARAIQGPEGCLGVLLRRRHHQYRRLPRGAEFCGGVEAAGDLRLREQPLHGIHADRRGHRGRASGGRPRRRLWARTHPHRRQRRRHRLSHRRGGL